MTVRSFQIYNQTIGDDVGCNDQKDAWILRLNTEA
jgi:hypothetical protein